MVLIIELIYAGHVNVPKKNWSKFLTACNLLKINGFKKLGQINPCAIEKEFEMRNCYVKLNDVRKGAKKVTDRNDNTPVTENTPPSSVPGTPNTLSNVTPAASSTPSTAAPTTSKKASQTGSAKNSSQSISRTPRSRARTQEIDMPDLDDIEPRRSKRASSAAIEVVRSKKTRVGRLTSSDSDDSDHPIAALSTGKLNAEFNSKKFGKK